MSPALILHLIPLGICFCRFITIWYYTSYVYYLIPHSQISNPGMWTNSKGSALMPIFWYSHPYVIPSPWCGLKLFLLEYNKIGLICSWLHKIVMCLLLALSLPCWLWGHKLPCYKMLFGECHVMKMASGQQPARNWGPQSGSLQGIGCGQHSHELGSIVLPSWAFRWDGLNGEMWDEYWQVQGSKDMYIC